jgi:hypothetical protein
VNRKPRRSTVREYAQNPCEWDSALARLTS